MFLEGLGGIGGAAAGVGSAIGGAASAIGGGIEAGVAAPSLEFGSSFGGAGLLGGFPEAGGFNMFSLDTLTPPGPNIGIGSSLDALNAIPSPWEVFSGAPLAVESPTPFLNSLNVEQPVINNGGIDWEGVFGEAWAQTEVLPDVVEPLNILPEISIGEEAAILEAPVTTVLPQELPIEVPFETSLPEWGFIPDVLQAQRINPTIEQSTSPKLSTDSALSLQAPTSLPIPQEQIVEISEDEQSEKRKNQEEEIVEEEESEQFRLKRVVDRPVLEQRTYEAVSAIDLAEAEVKETGEEELDGTKIIAKISPDHSGIISGLLKEEHPEGVVRDGSWDEVKEEVASKKYASRNQAKQDFVRRIFNKVPVKTATNGTTVSVDDIARVKKYLLVRRATPVEIMIEREVKKKRFTQVKGAKEFAEARPSVLSFNTDDVKSKIKERELGDFPGLPELFKLEQNLA